MRNHKIHPDSTMTGIAFIRRLAAVILLIDLFVVFLVGLSLYKSRLQYEDRAAVETRNLAQVLEQNIEGSFDKVDLILLATAEEAEYQLSSGGINGRKLNGIIARQSARIPDLVGLRMVNAGGEIVYGTDMRAGAPKNVADRDYFIRLRREPNAGLVISAPLISRLTGKWVIVFARRVNRPDGSFSGAVLGTIPIEHLLKLFSSIHLGRDGAISLRDGKLGIIARYPEPNGAGSTVGQRTVSREFRNQLATGQASGTFNSTSPVDKIERKYTYRKFSKYPIYINVGLATQDYLSKWREEVAKMSTATLFFLLISIFVSRLIYSNWKRRNAHILTLQQQEAKFRTIADYTYDWEFWLDPDGEFIYTSPSSRRITGYDSQAFYADPGLLNRIAHADDKELFAGHRNMVQAEDGTNGLIFRINHADGSVRWLEHVCQPIVDSTGTFLGIRGSSRDITKRKKAEEALKRSEEKFRAIFNNSADPIIIRDFQGCIVEVNDVACQRLGYSREEMLRMTIGDIDTEKNPDKLSELPDSLYPLGQIVHERTLVTRDGREIPVEINVRNINFEGRELVLSIVRDITERKRAEKRLAELNDSFLNFGADSGKNIDRLVALCGELLGADFAAYSRQCERGLRVVTSWNTPPDFYGELLEAGSICYDVFHGFKDQVAVIRDLQHTGFAETDAKVSRYGISTYAGRTVSFGGSVSGLLCVAYLDDRSPGEEDKKLLGIIASAIGVEEERMRALDAMRESEATLRSITSSARDSIIMVDGRGRVSFWNETSERLFGWTEEEALGQELNEMIIPERYRETFLLGMKRITLTGSGYAVSKTMEVQTKRIDGTEIPVEVSLSAVQLKGEWHAVGIIRDITERKRTEAEIERMAYHDALTGLPNRLLLDDRLNQSIAHAGRNGHMTAVLFFDLDNFKSVNDSLGHPVGDRLLKKVVTRLGDRLRKSDTIARMGGDEFIVVLSEIFTPEDAAHVARMLLDGFSEPFELDGQELYTSASVGISLYPIDGTSTATLVKNADIAMYQAKKHARNSFQFYTDEINRRAEERLLIENELRHAVAREEFILFYQPWLDLKKGCIGGLEALIRWVHPQHGMILPDRFIPIAEETGLIVPMGEWVVKTACRFLGELQRTGLKRLTMCINVSGKQLRSPNLIGLVGLVLAEADFEPSQLELELTESSVMDNVEESRRYMDALKMLGVRLALDDFGTGYSSLSYLKRFPLDRLKIDRSFVRDCPVNVDDVAIARAVIALARSLNLQVTAEGVETMDQADFFSREKCDVIQGNLIGRPVSGKELMEILTEIETHEH